MKQLKFKIYLRFAVKQITVNSGNTIHVESQNLLKAKDCENLVKFYAAFFEDLFYWIITELCEVSIFKTQKNKFF